MSLNLLHTLDRILDGSRLVLRVNHLGVRSGSGMAWRGGAGRGTLFHQRSVYFGARPIVTRPVDSSDVVALCQEPVV